MDKLLTQEVYQYLKEKHTCSFAEMMQKFGISSATAHRYAAELAQRDAVRRVRGGLVFNVSASPREDASSYLDRVVTNRQEKLAAAHKALGAIEEGDIVFLDSSTTVYELAQLLREADFSHLTIVTNSLSIMQNFRKFPPRYVLIGLGGGYDPNLNSLLGSTTLKQLADTNLTKAFVSCFGVDAKNVTTNHERQAELLHHVLDAADRRYLVADRFKFNRKGLYRFATRGTFDAIFS